MSRHAPLVTRRQLVVGLLAVTAAGCRSVEAASYAPATSRAERTWLNTIGRLRGYSGCLHCGDRWNWKPRHTIAYGAGKGMFPLCEYDYWRLPVEQVEEYIRQLIREWKAWAADERDALDEAERLAIAAMRAERSTTGR